MAGILIVEDEFLLALDLEDIVSSAGYPVVGIVSDLQGLSALAVPPALALVDVNLRDGPTGVEIARTLSSQHGTRIIFVTANPAQIENPPTTAVGVIQKPFNPETIHSSLCYALNENEAEPPHGLTRFG